MIIFNSREQGKGKAASLRQGQPSAGHLAQAAQHHMGVPLPCSPGDQGWQDCHFRVKGPRLCKMAGLRLNLTLAAPST